MLGVGSVPMNRCGIYCESRAVPSNGMTLSDQRSSFSKRVRALTTSILHETTKLQKLTLTPVSIEGGTPSLLSNMPVPQLAQNR